MTLRLRSGSVATTAQSERYVDVGGERYGHVLDPRTGRPVPALGSVTVVAADPVVADILSTALFVMGPEAGRRWAAGRKEGILFLTLGEGAVVASWNEAFEQNRTDNQTTNEW
jgi:thiamine biosynthesis lipoprotein